MLVGSAGIWGLAALQHQPAISFVPGVLFVVPAVAFLVAWNRTKTTASLIVLATAVIMIGLLIVLFVMLMRPGAHRAGSMAVRPDLWQWLVEQGERTNESPERIGERAIATHRARIAGSDAMTQNH